MKKIELPLWQTEEWENFQKALGRETIRMEQSKTLLIVNPTFLGKKNGYIPRGPVLKGKDELKSFQDELKELAKKHNLIFTKVDPYNQIGFEKSLHPRKTYSVQPDTSLVLDLKLSEEELLTRMKRKGRYNIKLAAKKGVKIKMGKNAEEKRKFVSIFFKMLKETTERDEFSSHKEEYYQKMLESIPFAEILIAFHEDKPLAAGIFTYREKTAIYYYGSSSNQHRELMAPYLLQWEAIKEGKKRGCEIYDFLGIAPEGAQKNHRFRGITDFKKKFGGKVISYPKAVDLIHKPYWYNLYRSLKIMQKLF